MSNSSAAKRIVILTGSELRHSFFRKWMALEPGIQVLQTYCEGAEKSIQAVVQKQEDNRLRMLHLQAREQSERDFFELFVEKTAERSNPIFLPKGDINLPAPAETILALKPALVIAYGCSIIKEPLLSAFPGRLINIHLGLSPYYRGSGTNYWPLVNKEPEFVGVTFMHMDAGVDTGDIIHQIRARIAFGDTPHQIGNRLIVDMAKACGDLVRKFDQLKVMPPLPQSPSDRYYKKKDYTEESVKHLYAAFSNGLIEHYLGQQQARCLAAPIIQNPALL